MEKEINYYLQQFREFADVFLSIHGSEILLFCLLSSFILVTIFYIANKDVFIETPVIYIMMSYIFFVGGSPLWYVITVALLFMAILSSPLWGVIWVFKILSRVNER